MNTHPITIIGAGSWGTTLAILLANQGHAVKLWTPSPATAQLLSSTRENTKLLPGITIPTQVSITSDLPFALKNAAFAILAVPSHVLRSVLESLSPHLHHHHIPTWISGIKGIEQNSLMLVHEVLQDVLAKSFGPQPFVVLSGPTHAEEVARHIPSAIVAASTTPRLAQQIQDIFTCETLKVYTNADVIGVELGGSLKNVIALATGIADGLGLGDNSKAAVMTRGLAEMTKLGIALGAQEKTFSGLSGLGDLITTCTSSHSRNRAVGERLGRGESLKAILASMTMVAEGVNTTRSAYALACKHQVNMPIVKEMHSVLFESKSPQAAVRDLMQRPSASE